MFTGPLFSCTLPSSVVTPPSDRILVGPERPFPELCDKSPSRRYRHGVLGRDVDPVSTNRVTTRDLEAVRLVLEGTLKDCVSERQDYSVLLRRVGGR